MFLIVVAAAALAQQSSSETAWHACIDRTTTNYDWAQRGGAYIKQADAALNAEWKKLLAATSGKTKIDLIVEERAWLGYREIACDFYANGDWGREGQVLHYQACVAGVIERRTAELADYLAFVSPK